MSVEDELLMLGRVYVQAHAPYFGRAVLSLIPHAERRVPTLGVTPGMILYYNPDYLRKLESEKRIGTRLWHEVQHVLRHSFTRLIGVNQRIANICEDLAINTTGRHDPAWDFSPDGLLPEKYGLPVDLTAEEYYALVPPSAANEEVSACAGQCGGVAGNASNDELEKELDELYGREESEVEQIKQQVADDIIRHEKTHGTIRGGWSQWAKAILAPSTIRWQTFFQNTIRACVSKLSYGDSDYSMARPSRRSYGMPPGPFRPGLVGEEIEFAIVLDTSGSMDIDRHIKPCLREARGIIMQSGAEDAWFIQADAMYDERIRRVRASELVEVEIVGRGGTDFRPAIERAQRLHPKPSILIYLTDGYGPAPDRAPAGMEVIWCLVGEQVKEPATWGHVVRVPK